MPHFIIDCSENLIAIKTPEELMQQVYDAADATGLFGQGDIKVRINPFNLYNVGNTNNDFIHVFGNIMEGRTADQKNELSRKIVLALKLLFPEVPIISINIRDFKKTGYCNKSMVN